MRVEYLLLSVLVLSMLSCQPVNKDNVSAAADTLSDDRGDNLQQNIKRNVVRTTLIDSLKWVLYTFNYESQAISEETRIAVSPLACDLKLVEVSRQGKDTCVYYFDVFYKNKTEKYVLFPTDYIGIGTIKDSIRYLVGSHITSDPIPDRIFFSHEALFSKYLKKYKGEINAWLENEAIKRKVLE